MSADVPTLTDAQAAAQLLATYLAARPAVISPVAEATTANLMAYPALAKITPVSTQFDPAAKFVDVVLAPDKNPPSTIILTVFTRDGSGPLGLVERWGYTKTQATLVWQPGDTGSQSIRIPLAGTAKDGSFFQLIATPIGGVAQIVNVVAKAGGVVGPPPVFVGKGLPPWPSTPPTYVMDIPHLSWSSCGAGWTTDCVYNAQGANGETGFYADIDHPMAADAPPISTASGLLTLHTAPLATPFPYKGRTYQQQGAILVGYKVPEAKLQHGWAEMCARMPGRKGAWPAFWFMPANHVWSAEIDVHEGFGANPAFDPTRMTHHALHGLNGSFGTNSGLLTPGPTDLSSAQHCYGVVITADTITFYLDRQPNYQMVNPFPQTSFVPIFSVAVVANGPYTDSSGDLVISSYQSRTEK